MVEVSVIVFLLIVFALGPLWILRLPPEREAATCLICFEEYPLTVDWAIYRACSQACLQELRERAK